MSDPVGNVMGIELPSEVKSNFISAISSSYTVIVNVVPEREKADF